MLTGDKVETAKCVACLAGLKSQENSFETVDKWEQGETIKKLRLMGSKQVLNMVIEGDVLESLLSNNEQINLFFEVATKAASVVVCRCSPTQKAQVVAHLSQKGTTLAIGDGGNDVAMIQTAHVGIGITGKEGMQASLAAD